MNARNVAGNRHVVQSRRLPCLRVPVSRPKAAAAAGSAFAMFSALWAAVPGQAATQEVASATGSSLRLAARVQLQWEGNSTNEHSTFIIRRVWSTLDGSVNELVDGRVQFDVAGGRALEAWLRLNLSESFRLHVGQLKRGMSYFWYVPNFDLPVIERDARVPGVDSCPGVGAVCAFGHFTWALGLDTYEPGVVALGSLGEQASYRLGVSNGEGIGGRDVNNRKSVTGHLNFRVGGTSRFSLYGSLDDRLTKGGASRTHPAYGVEWETGSWRSGGTHLLASVVRGTNWKVSDDTPFMAAQVLVLWYRKLSVVSRFEAIEPMLRVSWGRTENLAAHRATGVTVTPGFMLYAAGANGIAANLDIYRGIGAARAAGARGTGATTDWSLKVQAFTRF